MIHNKDRSMAKSKSPPCLAIISEESQPIKICYANVLLVDDEPFNLIPLKMLVYQYNLACDLVYNGKEAVEMVQKKFSVANERLTD